MSKPTAKLEAWRDNGLYFTGIVTGHPFLADETYIYTSLVISRHIEEGWIETLNTRYELGISLKDQFAKEGYTLVV